MTTGGFMLELVMGATLRVARTFLTRFVAEARPAGMNMNVLVHFDAITSAKGAAATADGPATSSSTRLSTTSVRPDGVRKIGMWAEA
jgi:hypothetical protein